jgi:hypothetical protein
MKNCRRPNNSTFLHFIFSVAVLTLLTITSPAFAQTDADSGPNIRGAAAAGADSPASRQAGVRVMVEMSAVPASVPYAAAYKAAVAQADAARIYAQQHPNLKSSKALLSQTNTKVQISSAAASQVATAVKQIDSAQRAMLSSLTGNKIGGKVLFRTQRAYNGIAMLVSPDKIATIAAMPGVKAVHPMQTKFRTDTFSDIDFLGTRSFWIKAPFGIHGENIKVADIDSGLDYIHRNFGGPGSSGYALVPDHTVAPNAFFPTPKVPGGYDFAGDDYDANLPDSDPNSVPQPDPDPFDCGGHGTGTASLIAGYGVTNGGFTYSGSYDASAPDMTTLTIPPGHAPNAKLYPLRVFGCGGSTNLVIEAIEWAMDPNGDGNFSDRMDVINMSLGSNEGYADDPDDIAASNASGIGILVCSAAGNAGDTYYVHSSPAAASGTLSCAATYSNQAGYIYDSTVTINAPVAGSDKTIYTTTSPHTSATADVCYAINPISPSVVGSTTHDGGQPLTNAASCAGKIILVDRVPGQGSAASVNCQNAGAVGILDKADLSVANGDPFLLTTSGSLTKPMVVISKAFGDNLEANAGFNANGVSTNGYNLTIAPNAPTSFVHAPFGPGTPASAGAPDTVPSYTSRGPRLPDSALKPDIASPAEVTAIAEVGTGNLFGNFNGTSSATPHVSGEMALLRQFHPTWTVQELNALACGTSTHDLTTTVAGATKIGVGRIGAGRADLTNAAAANVVAYNGTDPNLIGVSFGAVEVPVDGSRSLTKTIKVVNKGTSDVTYNITYLANTNATGASYTLPASVTVLAGSSSTFNVTFSATGNLLKHERDLSTGTTQATSFGTFSRQYLTEHAGYAVLTPTGGSEPTQRVALYAAPKPSSAMHATVTGIVPDAASGSFTVNLSGSSINQTGVSGFPTDIVSYVKAFELQFASPLVGLANAPTDRNMIKYVGITSDWNNRSVASRNNFETIINFAIEGFGNAPGGPDFNGADKEIFIDLDFDAVYDLAIFLTRLPNGTSPTNVYFSELVDLAGILGPAGTGYFWDPINARGGVLTGTSRDTNSFNNSVVTVPFDGFFGPGQSAFNYQIVTFDRNGQEVDETPVLYYDVALPGLDANGPLAGAGIEPFFLNDLPSTAITVNYNGTNFQTNSSIGTMVVHMHNGTGNKVDVVAFRKPTISGFTPSHGKVGSQVTITGSNFGPGTIVKFTSNKTATINVLTANTLVATVPAGAVTGPIRASNAAGTSTSPGVFTVDP